MSVAKIQDGRRWCFVSVIKGLDAVEIVAAEVAHLVEYPRLTVEHVLRWAGGIEMIGVG